MRSYSANGVVVKRIDLGEKDRIITIFTKEYGKISAVAKGARRPGSKLAGASELMSYSKLFLSKGKDLDILTQADIKESFPNVRCNLNSLAHAIYILELASSFVDENQPNPDLFDNMLSTLYVLEAGTDPEISARYFEMGLLKLQGYEPHFEECVKCGCTEFDEKISFNVILGGVECGKCRPFPIDSMMIRSALCSYVDVLRKSQPQELKNLKFPIGAKRELEKVLKWHIRYRLEKELKSFEFIKIIEDMQNAVCNNSEDSK
ncbi:MAG: DNA repair protein RecO [Armatimonadota bacterium]